MHFIVRTVVQGFALALGAALFKKIQDRVGLGEAKDKKPDEAEAGREPTPTPTPIPDPDLPS
jgi:hypothetical protein